MKRGVSPNKHGHRVGGKVSLTYESWRCMMARCRNPNNHKYPTYGGKGVDVCSRWLDFINFLKDMGERPSRKYSIDRIAGGLSFYEPGNCRWATGEQQSENRITTRQITFRGKTQSVLAWSRETGIPRSALAGRLARTGWSVERALTTPVHDRGQGRKCGGTVISDKSPRAFEVYHRRFKGERETRHVLDRTLAGGVVYQTGRYKRGRESEVCSLDEWEDWVEDANLIRNDKP